MKLAPFVALRPTLRIFGLASAKLAKVLRSPGREVGEKLHLDSTKRFTCIREIRMHATRTQPTND